MDFIAIDFETANHKRSSACQIGLAKVLDDKVVETKSFYIKPVPNYYEPFHIRIHHIDNTKTDDAPFFDELWHSELSAYVRGYDLVAHNAPFEKSVFNALYRLTGIYPPDHIYDTLKLSRGYCPELLNFQLDTVCDYLGVDLTTHHDAESDAKGCAEVLLALAKKEAISSIEELDAKCPRCYSQCGVKRDHEPMGAELFRADEDMIRDKVFCFTGNLSYIRRDVAAKVIEEAGGIFKNSLSSKVNYLVVGDLSMFGDNYASKKLQQLKEYREKGCCIEVLTEEQFQEIVVYEGKSITKEMIESDSRSFLEANQYNILCGKNVCVSEGFSLPVFNKLSCLGIYSGVTFWEDEASSTDYFLISNKVLEEMKKSGYKSPRFVRMEDAMNRQANPEGNPENHHIKCIDEDTLLEFLKRTEEYVNDKRMMKTSPFEDPHSVTMHRQLD